MCLQKKTKKKTKKKKTLSVISEAAKMKTEQEFGGYLKQTEGVQTSGRSGAQRRGVSGTEGDG